MTILSHKGLRSTLLTLLALAAGAAQAHTGHAANSLFDGLLHPLGLDHLLAVVAVGVWSVGALPAGKTWWGPTTFLLALVLSAAGGAAGFMLPYLEQALALSVLLFGLLLALAGRAVPLAPGLGLVALAASLHGLAHGAEIPATGPAGYAAGFLLSTAVLHLGGVAAGLAIRRWLAAHKHWVTGGLGAVFSGAGLYLLQQL